MGSYSSARKQPSKERKAMPVQFDVTEVDGVNIMVISGSLDEDSELDGLLYPDAQIADCRNLTQMYSVGIRKWVLKLQERPADSPLTFTHCSIVFIEQLNLITGFVDAKKVESFYAPYFCDECDKTHSMLLIPSEIEDMEAPEKKCPEHNTDMTFDDDEEEYFEFLAE